MSIIVNSSTVKKVVLADGIEVDKVIKADGTVIFESIPDIIYLYNSGANPDYPLLFTGYTHSAAYSENGARDEGTNVYLGASVSGSYHSACYICYTTNKIDITKFKKLIRYTTSGTGCYFGICKEVPEATSFSTAKCDAWTNGGNTELDISSLSGEYYIVSWVQVYTTDTRTTWTTRLNQLYLTV